ncbi:MAG: hypothetical protein A4E72_01312 [Syntrophus sp. PtaU1.Bin208]|nr:MAG: hypothetical protein A4E72_01312 [Syntrophus sp. PtaU1.Bin208]
MVLAGTCMAAEPFYDAEKLRDQADQIELEAKEGFNKASSVPEVTQIMGNAQLKFSRILMSQNNRILQQQDKIMSQNNKILQQNDEILRLLHKDSK